MGRSIQEPPRPSSLHFIALKLVGACSCDAIQGKLMRSDDGGFSGHTWLEPAPGEVLDLMHDADDTARYIRRPKMERAVKQHWRAQMRAAIAHGARHRTSSNVVEKSA